MKYEGIWAVCVPDNCSCYQIDTDFPRERLTRAGRQQSQQMRCEPCRVIASRLVQAIGTSLGQWIYIKSICAHNNEG